MNLKKKREIEDVHWSPLDKLSLSSSIGTTLFFRFLDRDLTTLYSRHGPQNLVGFRDRARRAENFSEVSSTKFIFTSLRLFMSACNQILFSDSFNSQIHFVDACFYLNSNPSKTQKHQCINARSMVCCKTACTQLVC